MIKHQDTLRTGVKIAKDVVNVASTIAAINNMISPETHAKVKNVTKVVSDTVDSYEPKKKGKGWYDYDTLQ